MSLAFLGNGLAANTFIALTALTGAVCSSPVVGTVQGDMVAVPIPSLPTGNVPGQKIRAEGTGVEPATGFPAPHFQCGR